MERRRSASISVRSTDHIERNRWVLPGFTGFRRVFFGLGPGWAGFYLELTVFNLVHQVFFSGLDLVWLGLIGFFIGFTGFSMLVWVPVSETRFGWVLFGFYWVSPGFFWVGPSLVGFCRVFHWLNWFFMCFCGFQWVKLDLAGFDLGFTGFN